MSLCRAIDAALDDDSVIVADGDILSLSLSFSVSPLLRVALCSFLLRDPLGMSSLRVLLAGGDFVGTASYIVRPRRPLSWLDPGVFGTLGVGGGFLMGACVSIYVLVVWK